MKPYQKLILAFVAIVLLACVLSPIAKLYVDGRVQKSEGLADKLHYDEVTKTYRFGKVFRRTLMVSAIIVLIAMGRALQIGSVAKQGYLCRKGWWRDLASGAGIGMVSMAAFLAILYLLGATMWRTDIDASGLISNIAKFLLAVACIGLFEETLFRGVVLQTLMKDMRFLFAAVLSSVLYSLLHFFKANVPVGMGGDWLIGFRALEVCFTPLVTDPTIIPAFLGLFLLGMVFAYAYRWTSALYLPIALHASWVFALKTSAKLLYLGIGHPPWLYGTKQIVDGLLGCVFLLVVLILLCLLYRRPSAKQES
ncbi:MAG: CPBP family intramembrane metalloprotease [Planctomycetes bacterium]|nr:CPBP family intramembrane metalloprotease [Planctomycetota bacterium]